MRAAALAATQTDPAAGFLEDVLEGLGRPVRALPCKYLYDERGSGLFEAICGLPEYYPTRTELAIMRARMDEIAATLGEGCVLIEYGSGSSRKTRELLDRAPALGGYVPIDISADALGQAVAALEARYPRLPIRPVCADYTRDYALPPEACQAERRVVYFPGSTIGNFSPGEAVAFLAHMAGVCGPGGGVLIGVDLLKDPRRLRRAYDDAAGVTAAFNLNLLERINRELDGDFDLERWGHYAFFNPREARIEMHLASLVPQTVRVGGVAFRFGAGETIWTESSYKYAPEAFARLAARAGLRVARLWTDPEALFSVQFLVAA